MAAPPLYPLRFKPYLRPMPWGGRKLRRWVRADFPPNEKIGEAWLLSDHTLHASVVANGPLAGATLRQLMAERGAELLGFEAERFPLLIKLLDASENLSIQVHPDDELAKTYAPKDGGKTEAWLALEAEPDAWIYLGLAEGADRDALRQAIADGSLPRLMKKLKPAAGDCYFVPAGAVHALGGGTVVLEVQQTSDATFRLYDWDRVGPDGQPRTLHLEAGLACLKPDAAAAGKVPLHAFGEGYSQLLECPNFAVDRLHGPCRFSTSGGAPAIAIVLAGTPRLGAEPLSVGDCLFIPAAVLDQELLLKAGDDVALAFPCRSEPG